MAHTKISLLIILALIHLINGWKYYRLDEIKIINSSEGHKHTDEAPWFDHFYCDENQWAVGMQFKSNTWKLIDGTAAEGIRLICADSNGIIQERIETAAPKKQGVWDHITQNCTSGYLIGFKTRVQPPNGPADDNTLICIQFQCSNDNHQTLMPDNCLNYGSWASTWSSCPAGSYICGLQEQYENDVHICDDDTGLNAARFYCCSFDAFSSTMDPTPFYTPPPTMHPIVNDGATITYNGSGSNESLYFMLLIIFCGLFTMAICLIPFIVVYVFYWKRRKQNEYMKSPVDPIDEVNEGNEFNVVHGQKGSAQMTIMMTKNKKNINQMESFTHDVDNDWIE
eukprot:362021_1